MNGSNRNSQTPTQTSTQTKIQTKTQTNIHLQPAKTDLSAVTVAMSELGKQVQHVPCPWSSEKEEEEEEKEEEDEEVGVVRKLMRKKIANESKREKQGKKK